MIKPVIMTSPAPMDSLTRLQDEINSLDAKRRSLQTSLAAIDVEMVMLSRRLNGNVNRSIRRAAGAGDLPALSRNLPHAANVDSRNLAGESALFLACCRDNNEPAVRLLLSAKADPNLADFNGTTPLMVAVRPGQLSVVKVLLEAGAHVDDRNFDGDTALTNAATWGVADVVRMLIDRGADPKITDGTGLTAAELARQQGHLGIFSFLTARSAGASEGGGKSGRKQREQGRSADNKGSKIIR